MPANSELKNPDELRQNERPVNLPEFAWRAAGLLSGAGARQGYLAAADQGVMSLANFVATIILARAISPTELGVYGVGFTALRLVRAFQEGLTVQPLNIFGAAMPEEEFRGYASSTTLIHLALVGLSAGGAALGGWLAIQTGNDVAGPTLFALWFSFLFWQPQEYLRRVLYARQQVFHAFINTLVANLVRLGLMVWWGGQGRLSGVAGLDAIAWGSMLALVPGLWQTRAYWTTRISDLRRTWARNWGFGRYVLGGALAGWVAVEFYPVLTAGMISFAAAGAYRALQNLIAPQLLLQRAAEAFLTPRAARAYRSNGLAGLKRQVLLTDGVIAVPGLGILGLGSLLAAPLLRLLYGETYVGFSGGMVLMALYGFLMFLGWPPNASLKAAGISRPILVANVTAIVAMFTLGIWMIQRWGVYGTIGGQALNAAVVAGILGYSWLLARRRIGMGQ